MELLRYWTKPSTCISLILLTSNHLHLSWPDGSNIIPGSNVLSIEKEHNEMYHSCSSSSTPQFSFHWLYQTISKHITHAKCHRNMDWQAFSNVQKFVSFIHGPHILNLVMLWQMNTDLIQANYLDLQHDLLNVLKFLRHFLRHFKHFPTLPYIIEVHSYSNFTHNKANLRDLKAATGL